MIHIFRHYMVEQGSIFLMITWVELLMISGEDYHMHIFCRQVKICSLMPGFQLHFITRGFNFDNAILPDQIDPLGGVSIPSSESLAFSPEEQYLILGQGFFLSAGNIFGGFSINHLAEPDLVCYRHFK